MSKIKILDKTFRTFIPKEEIQQRVKAVAEKLNKDMDGKNPLLLVKLASYQGTTSTGKIKEVIGLNEDLTDRTVVIVEDIIDTGSTMKQMIESLGTRNPKSVHICSLLVKPGKLQVPLNIEYAAMEIPNDFIVGYGLDYDQQGRQLEDIYVLDE